MNVKDRYIMQVQKSNSENIVKNKLEYAMTYNGDLILSGEDAAKNIYEICIKYNCIINFVNRIIK